MLRKAASPLYVGLATFALPLPHVFRTFALLCLASCLCGASSTSRFHPFATHTHGGRLLSRRWACRRGVAVFRGEAHAEYGALVAAGPARGPDPRANASSVAVGMYPRVARISAASWRTLGRFGLIYQKCQHPDLLDVRVNLKRDQQAYRASGLLRNAQFETCAQRARDRPKRMSVDEQAATFQMAVCVEGSEARGSQTCLDQWEPCLDQWEVRGS